MAFHEHSELPFRNAMVEDTNDAVRKHPVRHDIMRTAKHLL